MPQGRLSAALLESLAQALGGQHLRLADLTGPSRPKRQERRLQVRGRTMAGLTGLATLRDGWAGGYRPSRARESRGGARMLRSAGRRLLVLLCACVTLALLGPIGGSLSTPTAAAASEGELVTVSGVLRTADGQPVPNVQLFLYGPGGTGETKTSSDGSFSLQAAAGKDRLAFYAGAQFGSPPASLHLPREFHGEVSIDAEQNIEQDIALPQVVALTGTVKDARGNPVEGATVTADGESETGAYEPFPGTSSTVRFVATGATTDAAGEATFYSFATPDLEEVIAVIRSGGIERVDEVGQVDATSDTSVSFTLPELVTVSGVLRTADGQPVPNVQLFLYGPGGTGETKTSSDGSFSLQAAAGKDRLAFYAGAQFGSPPASLHLPREFHGEVSIDAEQNIEQDIALPQVVAVTGTVKDARGNPVEGATVTADGESETGAYEPFPGTSSTVRFVATGATTDAAGEATFYSFATPDLEEVIAVIRSGGIERVDEVGQVDATSDTSVSFTLPELVTVSGVLRTADGQPVPNVQLFLYGPGGTGETKTSSDGSFSLQAAAGKDRLAFYAGAQFGSPPASLHLPREFHGEVSIDAEQNIEQDIALPQVVAVTGTVKDARGNPVEGATVTADGESETGAYEPFPGTSSTVRFVATGVTTDAAGEATFYSFATPDLEEVIAVIRSGGIERVDEVGQVDATSDTSVSFTLPSAPGPPAGVATTPEGEAIAVAWEPPANDGESPITGYEISASQESAGGSVRASVKAAASSKTVTVGPDTRTVSLAGLAAGAVYRVSVRADNMYGAGEPTETSVRTLGSASQSSSFSSTAPATPNVGSVYPVSATATSGLPVTLTIDRASTKKACTLTGSLVSFKKAGTCIIDANQAGNGAYLPAPEVQQTITITAAKASTATTLSLASSTVAYGSEQNEKVSVTATAAGGGTIPKGKVTVVAGSKKLCKITLVDGAGSCAPKATAVQAGSYTVTATLAGSSKFGGSTSKSASLEVT